MRLHPRFIARELGKAPSQALIFVLCVTLSLTTLVALNSFKRDVHGSLLADSRALHGGDIIVHSHYPFTPGLSGALAELTLHHQVLRVDTHEFYSVARTPHEQGSLLCNLKIVSPGYPLYGRVELKSGRPLGQVLGPGRIVVEQELLDRLHLRVGETLHLGKALLQISDVVLHEPDRPLNLFSLGPRVLVAEADLARLDLVSKGSRVEYLALLKVLDPTAIDRIAAQLAERMLPDQERVETFRTAHSGVKRFFDNLLFFLSLISIFTLLLAGIGMESSLAALLREREKTIAIAKALGATSGFLLIHYLAIVLILGLIGSGLGLVAGTLLARYFPLLFSGLVPATARVGIPGRELALGLVLAVAGVTLFAYLPLSRLNAIKPSAIFRAETNLPSPGRRFYLALGVGLLLLTGLIIEQLEDIRTGLYFMAGASLLITIIALLTGLALRLAARVTIVSLPLRQAVKSLFRPGNASRSIITTLAAALAVLLSIYLVEENLHATFVASYPAEAPNLFCLDIQSEQRDAFARLIPVPAQFFPIVRARLTAINDQPINRRQELERRRDNLAREFNLTYRDRLLEDELLLKGQTLFRSAWPEAGVAQVSILDTVAEMGDIHLHDLLLFNIQGVELTARVTSIRTRTRSRLYPFFYFVFPEPVLKKAPQTWFATLKVEPRAIPGLSNRIVAAFPNISAVNMAATAADLGTVLDRLSRVINFFALFSILAGTLIVVSAVFATRLARIREVVYYKILGATTRFVLKVFVYENLLLGLCSSLLAVILAQIGSFALCHYWFDIPYRPEWRASLVLVLATTVLVVGVGLLSSIAIIRLKPGAYLREQADG